MSEPSSSDKGKANLSHKRDLQGYVGATRELREACAGLVPGQMVCSASFTLMDSMAALQIMDPRMDSGIYPIPPHLIADCDKFPQRDVTIPQFDPDARLSATEICWIMDRLLACEIEWHKGASLSQTIHTCLYVHSLSSISPRASQVKGESPNLLVCRVLRPFLIALLRSVGLVWDEVAKGNLIDGEDFNCDKGGISLLEEVSLDEVEAWLGDAISYIQALGDSRYHSHYSSCDILTSDEAEALLVRIQLRESFLRCISIFSKVNPTLKLGEGLDPIQVLQRLPSALQGSMTALGKLHEKAQDNKAIKISLMSPFFSQAPSSKATSTFDPAYSRHPSHTETYNAPSIPPPPLPLPLKSPEETIASMRSLLTGLDEAMHLANRNACWTSWKTFFDDKAMSFQREATFAYVRSLWQSIVCSDGVIGLRFTLNWIADSFLNLEMDLDKKTLLQLIVNVHEAPSKDSEKRIALQRRMDWFLEKLAGQLVNHLCSLAQNRSRGRRRLAESYETLVELSTEAAAIEDSLQELSGLHIGQLPFSPLKVQVLTLDTMLHIVFSGFELDLYRIEECVAIYWVAHRIAEEKVMVLEMIKKSSLDSVGGIDDYLESQLYFTKALVEASRALETLFETRPLVRQVGLPWQPNAEDESVLQDQGIHQYYSDSAEEKSRTLEELDKVSFCKRFKWLRGKGRPESMQTLDTLWKDLEAERRVIGEKSKRARLDWSAHCLDAAIASLNQIPQDYTYQIIALKNSLQDISSACKSGSFTTQASAKCLLSLTFAHTTSHPWFPVLCTQ